MRMVNALGQQLTKVMPPQGQGSPRLKLKLAWKLGNEAKSVIVGRDNTASPTDIFVGVFIIIMVLPDNSQKNRIASFHFDNLNLFYVHKC